MYVCIYLLLKHKNNQKPAAGIINWYNSLREQFSNMHNNDFNAILMLVIAP